jgi:hypothetical protein
LFLDLDGSLFIIRLDALKDQRRLKKEVREEEEQVKLKLFGI